MGHVRANGIYRYSPVPIDSLSPACHASEGQLVRVVNLPGCPPCNTMGHAHILDALSGSFLGLCHTNSLQPDGGKVIHWKVECGWGLHAFGTYRDLKTLSGAEKRVRRSYPDWTHIDVRFDEGSL